ncbi:MAG: hypothetical protein IPJ77_00750 [Planctomycetes bacterium]|nr:hypothetical protein [Planctomycetota bacterium]
MHVRWSAMAALALGVAPNVPGFLKAAGWIASVPAWCEAVYPYAWFSGFAIAAVVHAGLGRAATKRAQNGAAGPAA